MADISMAMLTENQRRIARKLLENPEESKPREEMYAILHEVEEWLGPLIEQIKKTNCRDISLEEICALTWVIEELERLDRALGMLDRARCD